MDALAAPDPPATTRSSRLASWACALIGHAPDRPPLWNHGHGFAHCTRCGKPIVRTIVHGWRLPPRGYQVRWPVRERSLPAQPVTAMQSPGRPVPAGRDFMRDPLAGEVSSAFDFDDFSPSERHDAPAAPPRRSAS